MSDEFSAMVVLSSHGKDSGLLTIMSIEMLKRLKLRRLANKPLVIATANTRVENPLIENLVFLEITKIKRYAKEHDLPIHIVVGQPNLISSWPVKVIAGNSLPPIVGGQSWCSTDWKILALSTVLTRWKKNSNVHGELLKLSGMRFLESNTRGHKMQQRNDSSTEYTINKKGEYLLSPIAELDNDEVWILLTMLRDGLIEGSYSDLHELFNIYQKAGNSSCALIADDRLKGQQRGGCGTSRTGCWCCTMISVDKSMENIADDHPEFQNLNRIRNYVQAITFDFSKRNWVGRTILDGGFLKIYPDSFSPEVVHDLLKYCLSADLDEKERAKKLGIPPAFEIISQETLILIGFYWSIHGTQKPYEIWRIHADIVQGNRYYPPKIETIKRIEPPEPRYLQVGAAWDGYNYESCGLRDLLREDLVKDFPCEEPLQTMKDGRLLPDYDSQQSITVNMYTEEYYHFFDYIISTEIQNSEQWNVHSIVEADTYIRYGLIEYNNLSKLDDIMKRSVFKQANQLTGNADVELMLKRTISKKEYQLIMGIIDSENEFQGDLFGF